MARTEDPNWKAKAFADFFAGTLNRYLFEKAVDKGIMARKSIPKDIIGRGRNPVEYTLTAKGWKESGREPFEISVNTKKADSAESETVAIEPVVKPKAESKPKAEPVAVAVERPMAAIVAKPVSVPVIIAKPVPSLSQDDLAAIERKPAVTKSERAAYFANANWNPDWQDPTNPDMPAFLNRKNPVWQEWFRREREAKGNQ